MGNSDDADALFDLTAVRGVGLRLAQMFLVHQFKRPAILSAGDMASDWQQDSVPGIEETRMRALPWSLYRTYAAALLWTSLAAP